MLFERLHRLEEWDYERIGVRGNPAYSGLRRGYEPEVHIRRGKLEDELIEAIERFMAGEEVKHLYLFSREGGAGKSHTQHILRKYCHERDIPFADIWHEDVKSNLREIIPYMLELMKRERVVVFLECDMPPEIYAQLADIPQCLIIGSGHEPHRELAGVMDRFRVLDIERDYPLTHEQLYDLLRATMDELRIGDAVIVEDDLLRMIAERVKTPGDALNVLGVLLAIVAYKAREGEEYEITERDVRIWTRRGMPKD
jgi:hypothetical protein